MHFGENSTRAVRHRDDDAKTRSSYYGSDQGELGLAVVWRSLRVLQDCRDSTYAMCNTSHGARMTRRVAYQGEPGAYSDLAIRQHFGEDIIGVPHRSFPDALQAVVAGDCDLAMIPVENAIAGPVHVALEAMREAGDQLVHVDEHRLVIVLCVLGVPGAMLATVQRLRSHPVAHAQCRIFAARHPWLTVEVHADTAGAAREVSECGDPTVAAIASELAAERYGLEILVRGVQDVPHNWTRFLVLARG